MKKNSIWHIVWIISLYALLITILYLVVIYKVKWEDRDHNKYLYFYDCGDTFCTTDIKVDNYYSNVICNNKLCPIIVNTKNNLVVLRENGKEYIFDYLKGQIINDTYYYDVYNKVVKFIMRRRRSEKEINEYIESFEIDEDKKNSIIQKLKSINLINDNEYCSAYINDKLYMTKEGINKIKKDLLNQNIPIDVIEYNLKNVDSELINKRLEDIIIKKIKVNKKYSNNYLKNKILNDMINLGYDKNTILDIIDKNIVEDNNILIKEFDKTYSKLKNKYSEFELENKVKQKLILKGFNISDISRLIQEKEEN